MLATGPEWIWMQPRLPTKHMIGMPPDAAWLNIAARLSSASCQA